MGLNPWPNISPWNQIFFSSYLHVHVHVQCISLPHNTCIYHLSNCLLACHYLFYRVFVSDTHYKAWDKLLETTDEEAKVRIAETQRRIGVVFFLCIPGTTHKTKWPNLSNPNRINMAATCIHSRTTDEWYWHSYQKLPCVWGLLHSIHLQPCLEYMWYGYNTQAVLKWPGNVYFAFSGMFDVFEGLWSPSWRKTVQWVTPMWLLVQVYVTYIHSTHPVYVYMHVIHTYTFTHTYTVYWCKNDFFIVKIFFFPREPWNLQISYRKK